MAKKVKLEFFEEKVIIPVQEEVITQPEISFDMWWAHKNLPIRFKTVIEKHFTARGFMLSKKFDDGLKDFGY